MPLRIRVPARWVDELLAYLRELGADAWKERNTIVVRRIHRRLAGEPVTQDLVELDFVLRGWANNRPGVDYEIDRAA